MENSLSCSKVKKIKNKKLKELGFLVAILIIPTLNWLVFWLYVNFSSFLLAFKSNAGAWSFINFSMLWDQLRSPYGDTIGLALINTLKYFATSLFVVLPLSIIISYFIYKKMLFHKFFRTIFFLPTIISGTILVSVYSMFILPGGAFDQIISVFGLSIPDGLLTQPDTATNTIIIYCIWFGFGTNVVLIGSAMSRMPVEVFESAKLDGCGAFREIVSLILPLIWSNLSTIIILLFTGLFSSGGPVLLFAPNGEAETSTLAFWIFKQVYGTGQSGGTGNYGLVSAAGIVFTAVGVPIILGIRRLFERIPAVEY